MNFDIKDVKSWANRHDVKTLSVTGFFGDTLLEIDYEIKKYNNGEKDRLHELYSISDIGSHCFGYAMYCVDTGAFGGTNNFAFFLPLEAVKEELKEKTYRPFKTIREFEDALNKDNTSTPQAICVGEDIFIRAKQNHNRVEEMLITSITRNKETNEVLFINTCSPSYLFDRYEIRVGNKWLPFGVEIEND